MNDRDVVIIGGGPAGIACSIQLKRFGFNPLIIEKNKIGGLLRNANLVENYCGFPQGIKGLELVKIFNSQLDRLNIEVSFEEALESNFLHNKFITRTQTKTYESEYLVVSTGTIPKKLDIEIPASIKQNIFYEITEIKYLTGQNVAILGAGDAAFDYALNIANNHSPESIRIFNRSEKIKALRLLYERSVNNPVISYFENHRLINLSENNKNICLEFSENRIYSVNSLLVAIGREENNSLLKNFGHLDPKLLKNKLFVTGDVNNGIYRQTSIAAGEGIKAAMKINSNKIDLD